jgi:hypothetical protein
MLKRVLVGLLVGGLSIGLIAGAINRTTSKDEGTGSGIHSSGRNQRQGGSLTDTGTTTGGRNNDRSDGRAAAALSNNPGRNGNGGGNSVGANSSQTDKVSDGLTTTEMIYSVTGMAIQVDETGLALLLPDAEQILIEGRAWKYALESGFSTAAGHTVSISGFDEDGEFKVVSMLDLDTLVSITLRTETGRPLWAGRGGRSA